MMKLDLRGRIALALLSFSLAVASLVAAGLWAGHVWLEYTLLDGLLQRELSAYAPADTPPAALNAPGTGLHLYRPARWGDALPAELASLPPGTYRDLRVGEGHFHVLVHELAPGDLVVLTYDLGELEAREEWLRGGVLGGLLMMALLCWPASGWIAARLLQPLDSLVQRIEAQRLDQPQALAEQQEDGELAVIVRAHNHLLEQLKMLVMRERAFAAAAGHELKTPLTTLRLIAGGLAAIPAVPAETLARMERVLGSTSQTLDSLLALAGRLPPAPEPEVRLDHYLPALAEPYRQGSRSQLHYDLAPLRFSTGATALGIIFTNLLRNALRAAPQGTVWVRLTAEALSVQDDGEGIAASALPAVFEPGVHGKNGGSGMGLYISRLLAERQGWSLRIESAPAAGSTAFLQF